MDAGTITPEQATVEPVVDARGGRWAERADVEVDPFRKEVVA